MPESREIPSPSSYDAKRLSPEALAAQQLIMMGEREAEKKKEAIEKSRAAELEAREFIDKFLDNPDYRGFVKLLESGDVKAAQTAGRELADQMDELAAKAPKLAQQLVEAGGLKDRLIAGPLAESVSQAAE